MDIVDKTGNNRKTVLVIVVIGMLVLLSIISVLIFHSVSSPKSKLQKQLDLGSKYYSELDFDNAVIAYEKAIEIDPQNIEAYCGIINSYIQAEDLESAQIWLNNAYNKAEDPSAFVELENLINSGSKTEDIIDTQKEKGVGNLWVYSSLKSYNTDGSIEFDRKYEYFFTEDGYLRITYNNDSGTKEETFYNQMGFCYKCCNYDNFNHLINYDIAEYDADNNLIKVLYYEADGSISWWTEYENWGSDDIKATNYDYEGNVIDNMVWFHYFMIGSNQEEYENLENDDFEDYYETFFADNNTVVTDYSDGRKTIIEYDKLENICN